MAVEVVATGRRANRHAPEGARDMWRVRGCESSPSPGPSWLLSPCVHGVVSWLRALTVRAKAGQLSAFTQLTCTLSWW